MTSSSDRQSRTRPAPPPALLRQDGTAPRSLAERLRMLLTLSAICLAVGIPTVVVSYLFGQRPAPKTHVQPTPEPGGGLRATLQQSANSLLPPPTALTPDDITLRVRPDHLAARAEKIKRQAAAFGGTATEGLPDGRTTHLYVDLPAAASEAFRRAVTANAPLDPAPSALPAPPPTAATGLDHVEIFIRPLGDDE